MRRRSLSSVIYVQKPCRDAAIDRLKIGWARRAWRSAPFRRAMLGSTCSKMQPRPPTGMVQMTHDATSGFQVGENSPDRPHTESTELTEFSLALTQSSR